MTKWTPHRISIALQYQLKLNPSVAVVQLFSSFFRNMYIYNLFRLPYGSDRCTIQNLVCAVVVHVLMFAVNFAIASFARDIEPIRMKLENGNLIIVIDDASWWNTQSFFFYIVSFQISVFLPFILSCVYLASVANFIVYQFVLLG